MINLKESWKKVADFNNYSVSNLGRVRNDKTKKEVKGSLSMSGYLMVSMKCNDGKWKYKYIHRLVAETFVPNPNDLPEVNHISRIKTDNRAINLEWCTKQQNQDHSISREVEQYDLNTGKTIRTFKSCKEAGDFGFTSSTVSACCLGQFKQHKGFGWRYTNSFTKGVGSRKRPVEQYSSNGTVIGTFDSMAQAARVLGFDPNGIKACCDEKLKTYKGFGWRYVV